MHIPQSVAGSRGRGRLCSFSTGPVHAAGHCHRRHSGYDGTHGTAHDHRGEYWDPIYRWKASASSSLRIYSDYVRLPKYLQLCRYTHSAEWNNQRVENLIATTHKPSVTLRALKLFKVYSSISAITESHIFCYPIYTQWVIAHSGTRLLYTSLL